MIDVSCRGTVFVHFLFLLVLRLKSNLCSAKLIDELEISPQSKRKRNTDRLTALYVIDVIIGLCLGYGWSSPLLPFLPFIIIGFIDYIWEMFKKFYNLGYDEKRRI